jgi:hypothetical protein
VAPDAPAATQVPAYVEKYRQGMKRIGMTPEMFARTYSIALKLTPSRVHGH